MWRKDEIDERIYHSLISLIEEEYMDSSLLSHLQRSHSKLGYEVCTNFNSPKVLDIQILISDGEATISYNHPGYTNYSEYVPQKKTSSAAQRARDLFEIFRTLALEGAKRVDRTVGNQIVSSTLTIGKADKTTSIHAFKIFGRRQNHINRYASWTEYLDSVKKGK